MKKGRMLKLLSVLLVLCMMLTMLPVTVFAKPNQGGDEIKIEQSGPVTLSDDLTVKKYEIKGKPDNMIDVTLDLNGKDLLLQGNKGKDGTLKIENASLTITATNGGRVTLNKIEIMAKGRLIIKGGTFNFDPDPYKADGCTVTGPVDGYWTVTADAPHVHTGGEATCMAQAVCKICNQPYGEKNPTNHVDGCVISYSPTEDGKKHIVTYSMCEVMTEEDHTTTQEATCSAKAVCEKCGAYGAENPDAHTQSLIYVNMGNEGHKSYYPCCQAESEVETVKHKYGKDDFKCVCGEIDLKHFENGTVTYTVNEDGTHTPVYTCKSGNHTMDGDPVDHSLISDNSHVCICGVVMTPCNDGNNDHKCDICGGLMTNCGDSNSDHKCDICGGLMTNCGDNDSNHKCDICGGLMTNCGDSNSDHKCDICGGLMTNCGDSNSDHKCDICGGLMTNCGDSNSDHKCDICKGWMTNCDDGNNDHACDICGRELTQCTGGKATCTAAAQCSICGKPYGEVDPEAHDWNTTPASYIDNKDGTHTPVYTCKNDANHKYNGKAVAHEFENCECVCGAEKTFTITYYASGKVYQVDTYKAGDEIVLPSDPTQADEDCKTYTFVGWNVAIPETMPAEDLWFTAIFEVNEKHNFEDGKCDCGAEDPDYEEPSVPSVPSTPIVPSVPSTPIKPAFPNWGNIFDKWFSNWWDKDEQKCCHCYDAVVTAPTCTEEGYTTYTCCKCGDSYKDDYTDALDHTYVDGKCACGAEDPNYVAPSVPSTPIVPSTPVKPSNPIKPAVPNFGWIIKAVIAWLK